MPATRLATQQGQPPEASVLGTHTHGALERRLFRDQENAEAYESLRKLLQGNGFLDVMESRITTLEENFQGLEGDIYTKIEDDFQTKRQELDHMIESNIIEKLGLFEIPDGGSSITLDRGAAGATTFQEPPGVGRVCGDTAKSKKKKRKKTKKKKKAKKKKSKKKKSKK